MGGVLFRQIFSFLALIFRDTCPKIPRREKTKRNKTQHPFIPEKRLFLAGPHASRCTACAEFQGLGMISRMNGVDKGEKIGVSA